MRVDEVPQDGDGDDGEDLGDEGFFWGVGGWGGLGREMLSKFALAVVFIGGFALERR